MTAVVSITNGTKRKHEKIKAFENDTGIKIRLCKTRSPQTKGKDESANRFISWLNAYDDEIRNEGHLIGLIERLNMKVNSIVNQTTNVPPHVLFKKEKEYHYKKMGKIKLVYFLCKILSYSIEIYVKL